MEILGLFVIALAVYGYITLKREGKEIGPNSNGRTALGTFSGKFGHCLSAGVLAIYFKIKDKN